MERLDHTWCPGGRPHMTSLFSSAAAADASPTGCGVMISSDDLPLCSHSDDLLGSAMPSSPSNSFEPAVAAAQHQAPGEPTLQQVLAHGHRHNTRSISAASADGAGGSAPPPEGAAAETAEAWQQGQGPALQQARRRIGRPIEFTGDIDSPDLNDADRRRLKRRAANRESARRVRQRRQEVLCTTQARLKKLQAQVLGLTARLHQAELQRAQLMQQVGDLLRRERAASETNASGNKESVVPPQQTAIREQGSAAEAAYIGAQQQAAADCGLPDTPTSDGLLAIEPLGAAADAGASARAGSEAVVTSGSLRSGSSNTVVAFAPAHGSDPKASRTVTTASSNASSCSAVRLVSSGDGSFLPPPLPAAASGAAGHPTVLSVTPSTGTTRLTCAAPPLFSAWDWGIPSAGQAPTTLPDLLPTGADEDWLAGKASVDLDALLLPPIGSL